MGYAAHLAAVESSGFKAQAHGSTHESEGKNRTGGDWASELICTCADSEEHPVARDIRIVDGSPEVLREVRMKDREERGESEDWVSVGSWKTVKCGPPKRKGILRRVAGELARRIAMKLWEGGM